jgi:hypothetical protein
MKMQVNWKVADQFMEHSATFLKRTA